MLIQGSGIVLCKNGHLLDMGVGHAAQRKVNTPEAACDGHGSDGSFVVNAYPVSVHYFDVLCIFVTVIVVGWLAVWYPVKRVANMLTQRKE